MSKDKPKDKEESWLDAVNKSGFPFQIAVANAIKKCKSEQEWAVLHVEHAWRSSDNLESGFIDLVLQSKNKRQVLVMECKRDLQDMPWIFLDSELEGKPRRHAKLFFNTSSPRKQTENYWGDGLMDPPQQEATFCVMHGNNRPMLERDAATLVSATEALAREEAELTKELQIPLRMYASILVTTAKLVVCNGDVNDISLHDGKLTSAKMYETSCVRFRKQLSSRTLNRPADSFDRFEAVAYAKEHTVLVVNVDGLCDLLADLELSSPPYR